MSDRQFERAVQEWLEDGSDRTPPAAIQAVLFAVKTTPQQRDLWVPRRFNLMPAYLRLAAAAVVVAVVLGAVFINRGNDQAGGDPGPVVSPTPQPSQSPGPAASGEYPTLQNAPAAPCPRITDRLQCLEPGTYQLGSTTIWPAVVTFDVPENWWYYEGSTALVGVLVQTEDALNGSGWGITFSTVGTVSRDPCRRSAGKFAADEVDTASELAAAMTAWPGFEATEPAPISDQTYPGVAITLLSGPRAADCPDNLMFTTAASGPVDAYPLVNQQGRPHETEFRIFEIEGELLVVAAMNFPETSPFEEDNGVSFDPERHVEHQVAMDAILDSIELKDPNGGTN